MGVRSRRQDRRQPRRRPRRWPRRWPRRQGGLVGRFALLSLLPVLGLGLVLSRTLSGVIEARYLSTLGQTTDVAVNSMASLVAADPSLAEGLGGKGLRVLQSMVASDRQTADLSGLVAYDAEGDVLFTSSGLTPSGRRPVPAQARLALRTRAPQARFTTAPAGIGLRGTVVELSVPILEGPAVLAVVHAYSGAAGLERAIAAGQRRTNEVLAGGLAVLWLLLFPIVVSASHRLRKQSAENAHLAHHDPLTGLPNRNLFGQRLDQALERAGREGGRVGLVLLDIDRFKEVNDTLGHQHGDLLLQTVAQVLSSAGCDAGTIARLGGDEFGVLLENVDCPAAATAAAERLVRLLEEPVEIAGIAITPQASVGVSLYPDHAGRAGDLLAHADVAMYAAKADHSGVRLYSPERDATLLPGPGLVTELRAALAAQEITCHYQPLARMGDGCITGVEALVRWQHPTRGLVPPGEFLPVVERAGLMPELTDRVLGLALRQCRGWLDQGLDLVVSVNLSARSLRDPGLPASVLGALGAAGVPAPNLELEITEDALLDDPQTAKACLDALAGAGVGLALDDFGTGYSSLAYLSSLPVDKVKIDRAFLADMVSDQMSQRVVESVIELGARLGMEVLAEGVETLETWERLIEMGCPQAQGFFLAPPMPAEAVPGWALRREPPVAAPGAGAGPPAGRR